MENQNGEADTLEQPEATSEPDTEETDESEKIQAELEKAKTLADNYKIRAEKAESKLKAIPKEAPAPEADKGELSQKDLIAVVRANVADDDIEEVADYAKLKKITIAEALKSNFVKSLLSEKEEQRKVANATNVSNARRGSSKVSDDALLENASKGIIPENDADLRRLVRLKRGQK